MWSTLPSTRSSLRVSSQSSSCSPAGLATDTAYIARVPFDSGSLIGHWTPQTYDRWEQGSVPHTLFRGDRFAQTLQRVEELKKVCAP